MINNRNSIGTNECHTKLHDVPFLKGEHEMEAMIKNLDRSMVKYLAERLKESVTPLADEFGIVIDVGNCSFNAKNCRFQLKLAVRDSNGNPLTEESESFKRFAEQFGFEAADLGRKFVHQGHPYTISGLRPKSRKYPVIAISRYGQEYTFSCKTVLQALGKDIPGWLEAFHQ